MLALDAQTIDQSEKSIPVVHTFKWYNESAFMALSLE